MLKKANRAQKMVGWMQRVMNDRQGYICNCERET